MHRCSCRSRLRSFLFVLPHLRGRVPCSHRQSQAATAFHGGGVSRCSARAHACQRVRDDAMHAGASAGCTAACQLALCMHAHTPSSGGGRIPAPSRRLCRECAAAHRSGLFALVDTPCRSGCASHHPHGAATPVLAVVARCMLLRCIRLVAGPLPHCNTDAVSSNEGLAARECAVRRSAMAAPVAALVAVWQCRGSAGTPVRTHSVSSSVASRRWMAGICIRPVAAGCGLLWFTCHGNVLQCSGAGSCVLASDLCADGLLR
jgi:hypothetical protein